jgi:protoporphyrinogen IX oxidase
VAQSRGLWPALVVTWLLGLSLAWTTGVLNPVWTMPGWFRAKLGFVLALTAYHIWLAGYHAALKRGERRLSGKRLRLLNEVPGLAAAVIVILVVLRPF